MINKKIAIVTGTRAEYGLLKPIIQKIQDDKELQLCLIVTGTHLSKKYGFTFHEIELDGFSINYKVNMNLENNTPYGISCAMGQEIVELAEIFDKEKIDMVILLGDRYEIETAGIAALISSIPIAHLHGGELTEGLIDDAIRHSLTKMSMLHFTSTPEYRKRVIQMGENPKRVFYVGALGTENIRNSTLYSIDELCGKFGECFRKPYFMITYHPVTLEPGSAQKQFNNLLTSLSSFKDYTCIFTYANADSEGTIINQMTEKYVNNNDNAFAFVSMGKNGYLSALKHCKAVIGNSSSGLIEAPSFHIPTVNIGNRQTGRITGNTVLSCGNSSEDIVKTISTALSPEFNRLCRSSQNIYDKEGTSETIVKEIKKFLSQDISTAKKFYDIDFKLENQK